MSPASRYSSAIAIPCLRPFSSICIAAYAGAVHQKVGRVVKREGHDQVGVGDDVGGVAGGDVGSREGAVGVDAELVEGALEISTACRGSPFPVT